MNKKNGYDKSHAELIFEVYKFLFIIKPFIDLLNWNEKKNCLQDIFTFYGLI